MTIHPLFRSSQGRVSRQQQGRRGMRYSNSTSTPAHVSPCGAAALDLLFSCSMRTRGHRAESICGGQDSAQVISDTSCAEDSWNLRNLRGTRRLAWCSPRTSFCWQRFFLIAGQCMTA